MSEPHQPNTNVASLGQQLRRALDSAGADASPTAGRLIGALLAALASSGGDDLVEASLVPGGGPGRSYEVRRYDIGNLVASDTVLRGDAAAAIRTAMAMVIGPDQTVEMVVKEADGDDRCVLMRSSDGVPVYVFEDTAPSLGPRPRTPETHRPPIVTRTPARPPAPARGAAAGQPPADGPEAGAAGGVPARPPVPPAPAPITPPAADAGFGPGPRVGAEWDDNPTGPMAIVVSEPDAVPEPEPEPGPGPLSPARADPAREQARSPEPKPAPDRLSPPDRMPLAVRAPRPPALPVDRPGLPADRPAPRAQPRPPPVAPPAVWSAEAADEAKVARRQAEVVEQAANILSRLPTAADLADQLRLARRQGDVVEQVATVLARLPTAADVADAVRDALAESTVSVDLSGTSGAIPSASASPTADEIAEVVVNRLVSEGRLPQATDPTGWLAALVPTAEEVADVVVRRLAATPMAPAHDTAAGTADRLQLEMELGRLETDVVREQMEDIRQTLDTLADAVAASERRLGSRMERLGDALADDVARLRRDVGAARLAELGPAIDEVTSQVRLLLSRAEPEDGGAAVTPIQRPNAGTGRPPRQRRSGA